MTNNTQKKFNLVKYVYGRVYAEYVASGKSDVFYIEDIKTRSWTGVLMWLKKNNHIKDFEFGKTLKDGFEVKFTKFNEENLMYDYYLKAIEKSTKLKMASYQDGITGKEIAEIASEGNPKPDSFDEHVRDVKESTNVERVSREDSTTTELNKEITKELVQAQ